jgi:hypothetical protein
MQFLSYKVPDSCPKTIIKQYLSCKVPDSCAAVPGPHVDSQGAAGHHTDRAPRHKLA